MDKIALNAAAKKLISLYGKGDSWKFMELFQRLTSGGRRKLAIPVGKPLQLDKFMRNRQNAVAFRLADRSDRLPILSQLYMILAHNELKDRIMDPTRRGNVAYLKRLRQHLSRRGFKALPGNRMHWRLPQDMQGQGLQVMENRALTAAQGALGDSAIGRYSPYWTQSKVLPYKRLFQPQEYSQYAPSKLQQLLQDAGIKNIH